MSQDKDDRATPTDLFDALNRRFLFTVDACATKENAKLPRFFTEEQNGLAQDWTGERVWCNPPYSEISPWVEKAIGGGADVAVLLIPANRTDQKWWHRLIEPARGNGSLKVEFILGRVKFEFPAGDPRRGCGGSPPFASCLVIALGSRCIAPNGQQVRLL